MAVQILLLLLLWHLLSRVIYSVFFPTPWEVADTFWRLLTKGDVQSYTLSQHAWASVVRVLKGFVVALLVGIPAGMILGLSSKTYEWLKIVLEPARFVPPLAWVPLAIIILGGETRYIFLIWLGAFFPILMTTITGVRTVDIAYWEVGQVLGANKWQQMLKIAIPAAAPHMITGARLGLGTGWACIVAAEMIGGESLGLGRMIINYSELLQIDAVVSGMIAIGLLGYLMNEGFLRLEKKLFPWLKLYQV